MQARALKLSRSQYIAYKYSNDIYILVAPLIEEKSSWNSL